MAKCFHFIFERPPGQLVDYFLYFINTYVTTPITCAVLPDPVCFHTHTIRNTSHAKFSLLIGLYTDDRFWIQTVGQDRNMMLNNVKVHL